MSALIATIREKPAPGRVPQAAALRRSAMAALGELLFYVVTQEPLEARVLSGGTGVDRAGSGERAWHIPLAAVSNAIGRCLEDAEYEGVRHYAAKTLENVLAQARPTHALVGLLVTPGLALRLLDLSR